MKVVVTGAAGYLGARVAEFLLEDTSPLTITELVLVDEIKPRFKPDPRIRAYALDLTAPGAADCIIDSDCEVLFHLAAIVSGHAEADFDLGFKVNFDATRTLLEAARRKVPTLKFIFTSTVGVFGGNLPSVVDDLTAVTPQNSYGTAKAMSELLINDYTRKGFVDGRIVRLPTVSVRRGTANKAVTSFASGIIREPLHGEVAICPVSMEQELWLTSPVTVVANIVHTATLQTEVLGQWRVVNLPGICVSVQQMIDALKTVCGEKTTSLIRFQHDALISQMVASFPSKFDNSYAISLGFYVDKDFVDIIRVYIRDDLQIKEDQ